MGYNPMATLLGWHGLDQLPAGQAHELTGRGFFPLISGLFHTALVFAFVFAGRARRSRGEARAALRDQWYGDPTDDERLRILDQALALVERQFELVRGRREKLADFAGELEPKRESLTRRRRELR